METKLSALNLQGNIKENWRIWKQKFEIYSTATELNKKDEKIQCAQLLYHMGEDAIEIYNSFTFAKEDLNKIEPLKKKFEEYFIPKKNLTYERYKFFTARQGSNTIEQFITSLKNQANNCEFGQEELKNELIKTMVIIGINDDAVREKLLQRESDTLEKAIECCILTEAARHQLEDMKIKKEIDAIGKRRMDRQKYSARSTVREYTTSQKNIIKNCTKCGGHHMLNKCPAFGKICLNCKKLNHFSKVCRLRKKKVDLISNNVTNENLDNLVIDSINTEFSNNLYFKYLLIENKIKIRFKIDTGASVNMISGNKLKEFGFDLNKIKKVNDILTTFTGEIFLN